MNTSKGDNLHEDLLRENVDDFERHIIISALKRTGGNKLEAAKQLGTTARIIDLRVHKYNIDINEFRKAKNGTMRIENQKEK